MSDHTPGLRQTDLTPARLDEAIVEPARWGLRRVGAGLGKLASAIMLVVGVMSGAFGATLMALTTIGFVDGLGAFFVALGITGIGFGGVGLFAVARTDAAVEARAVERRLLKMVRADGSISDTDAARRMRAPPERVRAAAERLVRAGILDVDVDPDTGADVYCAVAASLAELPAADADALRDFDDRLARETAGRATDVDIAVAEVDASAEQQRAERS